MIDIPTVAFLVRRAAGQYPTDGQALKSFELIELLLDQSPAPFSRDQFTPGHITCTGLVFAPDRYRILLVHHRRLDRWLLPGGHVEPQDPEIWESARREVMEETGALLLLDGIPPLIGADVHGIPSKGCEPYHLHHDLLFGFQACADEIGVSPESRAVAWCSPEEFDRYDLPGNIRRAYLRSKPPSSLSGEGTQAS
jgi:8-oxo-dGTP pyrophosphatase MutT (NUDIX family)